MTQVGQNPYPAQGPYNPQKHQQPFVQQQQQQQQQQQHQQQQNVIYSPVQSTAYTTLYTASGTPVQIVNVAPNDNTYHGYKTQSAKILGWMQIICGVIIFIAQVVVTALHAEAHEGGVGFYCTIFFILAGAFGVQSSKSKSRCTVATTLTLSIIAVIFSSGPLTQGSVGIVTFFFCYSPYWSGHPLYECEDTTARQVGVAFNAVMVAFGLIEVIVAVVAAAFCCHGCCCYRNSGLIIHQNPGIDSSGMQTTAVHYQHNPTQYYPAAPPMATVPTSSYSNPNNALPLLPAYSASASPPEYKENF